jgi:hypothetical protein
MKKNILILSIVFASGLSMVTVYNTVIDAVGWSSDIPTSVETARNYYKHVDPRNFFLIIGPLSQLLILLAVILFWKDSVSIRTSLIISFVLYACIVILTFVYFYPRDYIIFTRPIEGHLEELKNALSQWRVMNWLRTLFGFAGVLFSFKALDSYSRLKAKIS